MANTATYDDANLILKLFELRREEKMRLARDFFATKFIASTLEEVNQKFPPGSDGNVYLRMVLSYWDMVAGFITSGVLNEELFFQSGGELLFVWERVKDLVPQMREAFKMPTAYKNLETVGNRFIDHMKRQGPGAYEAFSARIRAIAAGQ